MQRRRTMGETRLASFGRVFSRDQKVPKLVFFTAEAFGNQGVGLGFQRVDPIPSAALW